MATGMEGGQMAQREHLSALVDGEADAASSRSSCGLWHASAEARGDWHAWQLIGDVLRSDELASDAAHDAAFLAAFRKRLAGEPVVLAPAPLQRTSGWASRWAVPSAVAAGLLLTVGTFTMLRSGPADTGSVPSIARNGAADLALATPAAQTFGVREAGDVQAVTLSSQDMVRDPQLSRYLSAHKQFSGTSALGVPSVFLRSATLESSGR